MSNEQLSAGGEAATSPASSGGGLELWHGPPASGKTTAAIALYAGVRGRRLWLAPNAAAARGVTRRLATSIGAATLGGGATTFEQFCGRLIERRRPDLRLLPAVSRRRLLRDVIDTLAAAGALPHFGPIARTGGFLRLVEGDIADFKRDEVWPEVLREAEGEVAGRRGLGEVIAIYAEYQRRLLAADLFDDDGRLWAARELLRERGADRYECVVVDGFADLSRTQVEIVTRLAAAAGRTIVTLPAESDADGRAVFAAAGRTADALRRASGRGGAKGGVAVRRFAVDTKLHRTLPAGIRIVADSLFAEAGRPAGATEGMRLLSSSGPRGEARAIAADVRLRLDDGARPGDVVIAVPELSRHVEVFEEAFADAGVPLAIDGAGPLANAPAVRLVRSLLRLEQGDWAAETVAAVVGTGRVIAAFCDGRGSRPNDPEGVAASITRRLRNADFDRGRAEAVRILTGESSETAIAAWTEKFEAATAVLRGGATVAGWVERLFAIGADLRLGDGSRSSRGWEEFRDVLGALARDDATLRGEAAGRAISLAAFVRVLDDALAGVSERKAGRAGGVRLTSLARLAGVEVPHLVLADLTEASLPGSWGDDCLLGEEDRRRLAGRELPVATAERRRDEQRASFLVAATRARRTLTLSCPAADGAGEAVNRSPYLDAILALFAERPEEVVFDRLDPVPAEERSAVSRPERRAFATAEAVAGRPGRLAAIAEGSADGTRTVGAIVAAAETTHARSATRGPTRFDGGLASPGSRRRLAKLFDQSHVFSASRLEEYATDPFGFFLSEVLGVAVVEPPGPRDDRAALGAALHAALAEFEGGGDLPNDDGSLARLIAERLASTARGSLFMRKLGEIESRKADRWASRYVRAAAAYRELSWDDWDAPPSVAVREAAFGDVPDENDSTDDQSRPPLSIPAGDGHPIRLRGRVDRVDVGRKEGRPAAVVIDYKSGNFPTLDAETLASGKTLQLPIYARAAIEAGLLPEGTEVAQVVYWSLRKDEPKPAFKYAKLASKGGITILSDEQRAALEAAVADVVPTLVAAIRAGHFVPPAESPGYRDFPRRMLAAVARGAAFRATAKTLAKDVSPIAARDAKRDDAP